MVNTSQEQLRYSARENILLGWPERGFYSVVKIYLIQIGQAHPVTSRYQATGLRVSNQGTLLNLLYLRKNLSLLSTTTQTRFLRLEGPSQAPSHSPAEPKPSLMPYSYCDFFLFSSYVYEFYEVVGRLPRTVYAHRVISCWPKKKEKEKPGLYQIKKS